MMLFYTYISYVCEGLEWLLPIVHNHSVLPYLGLIPSQIVVLMPSHANSPAILHLRDFMDSVGPDPSRHVIDHPWVI